MKNNLIPFVKLFVRSKINIWVLLVTVSILISVYLYMAMNNGITVFPKQNELAYSFFDDSENGGNSKYFDAVVTDSLIQYNFHLKEGYLGPYVGLGIKHKEDAVLNLSFSNRLVIDLEADGLKNMGLFISSLHSKGEKDKLGKEVKFFHQFTLREGRNTYEIDINKFEIPDWFLVGKNMAEIEEFKLNLQQLVFLNITTAYPAKAGDTGKIKLYSITFERSNQQLVWLLMGILLVVVMCLVIVHYFKNRTKNHSEKVIITYKPVEVKPTKQNVSTFLDFINQNFSNPDLTLETVAKQTGVAQRNIANKIQRTFNCNFKSYINQIRISESKRLLRETDLNVGEIAFKVGFNNQSHYNRVFKQLTSISPTAYREKNK